MYNSKARPCNHCCSGEAVLYNRSICSLRHPACNANAPYCHTWPARLYNTFLHYLIKAQFSKNKIIEHKRYLFWSSLQLLPETFSFYEELSELWSKMYIGLNVKYPFRLSRLNETWIFSRNIRKIMEYQNSLKSVRWEASCSMRADERTDRHD
jgi:hypothetical protein